MDVSRETITISILKFSLFQFVPFPKKSIEEGFSFTSKLYFFIL